VIVAKILVIDDDLELSKFLRTSLERGGDRVDCLESAADAPELLSLIDYDVVLLDDELFGHEPQTHTGAGEKLRKGRFEHATGDTLFLDEIGDMPPMLQAKLLRVLENHEVVRIGGNEPIKVDVRIVSATHRDLDARVRDGHFRHDLLFRLNGLTIQLPPLRERSPDDLRLLVAHFLEQAAMRMGKPAQKLDPAAWGMNLSGKPGMVQSMHTPPTFAHPQIRPIHPRLPTLHWTTPSKYFRKSSPFSQASTGLCNRTSGSRGFAPSSRSSRLGCVAAVKTVSPSQPRTAVSQRMSMALTAGGRCVLRPYSSAASAMIVLPSCRDSKSKRPI
jgi:hypothetical protein